MTARVLLALLIGLTALLPTQAAALTLAPGAEIILNWDLTGATPSPPYASVEIDLLFQSLIQSSPAQELDFAVYNDLNGGGGVNGGGHITLPVKADPTEFLIRITADLGCCPTIFDGLFSVGLTVTREGTDVAATAMGTVESGASTPAVPGVVPEPASFALLATGLAAVWFARRHRR